MNKQDFNKAKELGQRVDLIKRKLDALECFDHPDDSCPIFLSQANSKLPDHAVSFSLVITNPELLEMVLKGLDRSLAKVLKEVNEL